jgi:hypothetical protein
VLPSNHVSLTGGSGTSASLDASWETLQTRFDGIDTIGQLVEVSNLNDTASNNGLSLVYMTGGQVLKVRVDFPATYSVYTLKVFVFGFTFV